MLRSLVVLAMLCATARAQTRGVVRVQVLPLSLSASSDTPIFGDRVERALAGYNTVASARGEAQIDATDISLDETIYVLAPGLEADVGHYLFRMEAPIGISDDMRTYGIGLYPLGMQGAASSDLVLYISAGGSASWLDRAGNGDRGALFAGRAVMGARIARLVLAEVGYSAFAFGGTVNTSKLDAMDIDRDTPLPEPSSVIMAGTSSSIVDVSVGLSF